MFDIEEVLEEFVDVSYLPANYRKGSIDKHDLAIDSNGQIVKVYSRNIEILLYNANRDN